MNEREAEMYRRAAAKCVNEQVRTHIASNPQIAQALERGETVTLPNLHPLTPDEKRKTIEFLSRT